MKQYFFLSILILFSGCLVGPNYRSPEVCVSDEWHAPESILAEPDCNWWELFNDDLLVKYINLAAHHNYDLLKAEANIWQARSLLQVTASDLFPHVGADLDGLRTYFSKNGPIGIFEGLGKAKIPPAINIYNALIDATWEIDIFGKTRRNIESSKARVESYIEERNALLLSIFAEVAMNYVHIRGTQERIQLIEKNISLLEQNMKIANTQVSTGYSNKLNLVQIEAQLSLAKGALPDLYAQTFKLIYALSILTGNLPETFLTELLPEKALPNPPIDVTVGLRSDLLRRRPDVLMAERNLAAATASIGVAVASFFPSFNLIGLSGFQSLHLNNLFESKSLAWAILGDINIPIFQGGKLIGNLRASEAAAASAVANYQQTVLHALEETEGALISYEQELAARKNLQNAADHYDQFASITRERFQKGLVSMTDYLDAERQLISSELTLLDSKTSVLLDLIALYKALAGPFCFDET